MYRAAWGSRRPSATIFASGAVCLKHGVFFLFSIIVVRIMVVRIMVVRTTIVVLVCNNIRAVNNIMVPSFNIMFEDATVQTD